MALDFKVIQVYDNFHWWACETDEALIGHLIV